MHFSGPCSIVTFSLVFKHYGWYNLTFKGMVTTRYGITVIKDFGESALFLFVGLSFFDYHHKVWELKYIILYEFIAISLVRLGVILIVTLTVNIGHKIYDRIRKDEKKI